jgi:hypothetical protein
LSGKPPKGGTQSFKNCGDKALEISFCRAGQATEDEEQSKNRVVFRETLPLTVSGSWYNFYFRWRC